jgi:hypothetical protein
MIDTRKCSRCKSFMTEEYFSKNKRGQKYKTCDKCRATRQVDANLTPEQKQLRFWAKKIKSYIRQDTHRLSNYWGTHLQDPMIKYVTAEYCDQLWAKQLGKCHWCECVVKFKPGQKQANKLAATLDRKDNSVPHFKGNVTIACWGCNWKRGVKSYSYLRHQCDEKKKQDDELLQYLLA